MNYLNIFKPFESKKPQHEDVLTRNFLILLKNIPLVQVGFFEMIRNTVAPKGICMESSAQGALKLSQVYTQVDSNNAMFKTISDVRMLSIIISDDIFKADHTVNESDRHARYDGVVICDPSWVFIIENKPSADNIWEGQLDPNIRQNTSIDLMKEPCALSWRDVINMLNDLLSGNLLCPFEQTIIREYLEYIDENYSALNPYQKFEICKSDKYLLDLRCNAVLKTYQKDTVLEYRKGRGYYINTGNKCIQNIILDSSTAENNTWNIRLRMYAGDVMTSAREAYACLNVEKLLALLKDNTNYEASPNFHFAFRSSGGPWLDSPISLQEYVEFWKVQSKEEQINQIKRDQFEEYFDFLAKNGIVSEADRIIFESQVLSRNYSKLNVCPGFKIQYTWPQQDAIRLDRNGEFEADFRAKVAAIFDIFKE